MLDKFVDQIVAHKETIATVFPLVCTYIVKFIVWFLGRSPKLIFSLISQSLFVDSKSPGAGHIATRTYAIRNIGRKAAEDVIVTVGAPSHLIAIIPDITASITYQPNSTSAATIKHINREDRFEVSVIALGTTCGEVMHVRFKNGTAKLANMAVEKKTSAALKVFNHVASTCGIIAVVLLIGYLFKNYIIQIIDFIVPVVRRIADG